MRTAATGLLIGAGLVLAALSVCWKSNPVVAQRPPAMQGLIALSVRGGPETDFVAVIDPQQRVMGVYRIEPSSGEIHLRSVRNVHWDLQMDEFNGKRPSPREIRDMLE